MTSGIRFLTPAGRALRTYSLARNAATAMAALAVLAGCALSVPPNISDVRYDLGPAPVASSTGGPLPAVRMFEVKAPRALDSDAIIYRMSYVDPRRAAAYAHSHWTMAPAQLLTQRLRTELAARGAVLAGGETVKAPLLTVDLEQFEQVFDSEGESHGAVKARVTLMRGGQVLAQHTFVARAPARMPSAAGGVGALAAASDDFIAQLIVWLGMQAPIAMQ